jgi:hypothetical protein
MSRLITFSFVAALLGAATFMCAPASAAPAGFIGYSADASLVQDVGYYKKHRWWRSNGYETQVDAPTTSVDTSDNSTTVHAPFTSVHTDRRGTWVRAPFVNLFVPRD